MEPAAIDWKNVESKFVRDELYEHFNAPKWVDFSTTTNDDNDDEAWFCRPDCRHPKTAEDFLRITSTPPDLKVGDLRNNQRDEKLKRRGVLLPLPSPSRSKPPSTKKKFNEELENQDPNFSVLPAPTGKVLTMMKAKEAKETIKSSAEKPKLEEQAENNPLSQQQKHRLKSTFSARNLFAGQDILGQISEFCSEIKKFTIIRRSMHSESGCDENNSVVSSSEKEMEKADSSTQQSCQKTDEGGGRERGGRRDRLALLKQEVRSCPPSPQRIPSPLIDHHGIKQKEVSPLKRKPLRPPASAAPGRGILKELVQNQEKDESAEVVVGRWTETVDADEGCNFPASSGSRTLENMFWFFKPCSYLGR